MYQKVIRSGVVISLTLVFLIAFIYPALAINPQPEPPGRIAVLVDGSPLVMDVLPVIEQGRTLVPLRAIFEALGADVQWDGATSSITATRGNLTVGLKLGSKAASKNGQPVTLDVPAKPVNGRTLVPLRFIGEALGAEVLWDGTARTVYVASGSGQSYQTDSQVNPGDKTRDQTPDGSSQTGSTAAPQEQSGQPGTPLVVSPGLRVMPDLTKKPVSTEMPNWIVQNLARLNPNDKMFEHAIMVRDWYNANTQFNYDDLQVTAPKVSVDYSKYLTLTGNQDGWGGCIGRSIIHCMDIINEMQCPYTPDLSHGFLSNREILQYTVSGEIDTKKILEEIGVCPESSLPSDYDKVKFKNECLVFESMPQPTSAASAEAALYKIKKYSDPLIPFSAEAAKSLLNKYGPVIAGGPFPAILGPDPDEWHCVTLVGYNDLTKKFKFLNSWGDDWNNDGFFEIPYDKFRENVAWVRYIEPGVATRVFSNQAYSARIHVENKIAGRNKLTVKIGVEGYDPVVVWDTPNETNCVDDSKTLIIDVPLPFYAKDCWPPGSNHRWYLSVTNHDSSGTAEIKEFTLARLYIKPDSGVFTETFSADVKGTLVGNETKTVYLPAIETLPQITLPDKKIIKPLLKNP